MVKVEWTEKVITDLERLDKPIAQRILGKITWLVSNFERIALEPLTINFKGAFKLRVGDWRVVCTIESKTIVIQFIGHRREIYKIR